MGTRFCGSCGVALAAGEKFCGDCGAAAPPPAAAPRSAPTPPVMPPPVPVAHARPKAGMGVGAFAVLGVFLVAGLGAAGWFGYQRYLESSVAETPQESVASAVPPTVPMVETVIPPSRPREVQPEIYVTPVPVPTPTASVAPPIPPSMLPPSLQKTEPPPTPAEVTVSNPPQVFMPTPPTGATQTSVSRMPVKPVYQGPMSGVINWSGSLEKGGTVTIDGDAATSGKVNGDLPGVPVLVEIDTKEFALAEVPSPSNGWTRFTIRSKNKRQSVVTVHWKVLGQ